VVFDAGPHVVNREVLRNILGVRMSGNWAHGHTLGQSLFYNAKIFVNTS
jgi:hypothetical protein